MGIIVVVGVLVVVGAPLVRGAPVGVLVISGYSLGKYW